MRQILFSSLVLLAVLVAACGEDTASGPVNRPPTLAARNDTSVVAGDTLRMTVRATDPDGDALVYRMHVSVSLSDIRLGRIPDTTFDPQSGAAEFRAKATDRPSRDFSFVADDNKGGVDSLLFTVTVD